MRGVPAADIESKVAQRHAEMTPLERLSAASKLFDVGRSIVWSSLPRQHTREQRLIELMKRLYGDEVDDTALSRFAALGAYGLRDLK